MKNMSLCLFMIRPIDVFSMFHITVFGILLRKVALDVCRLRRRHHNANVVMQKLTLMSSLHQTQPTIQILLSGSEFSGEKCSLQWGSKNRKCPDFEWLTLSSF